MHGSTGAQELSRCLCLELWLSLDAQLADKVVFLSQLAVARIGGRQDRRSLVRGMTPIAASDMACGEL